MSYPIEFTTAVALCEYLWKATVFTTKDQLRSQFEILYDVNEFEAGLTYAIQHRWIRPAHVGDNLTLTFGGARAVVVESASHS
jgi:hypothetical protein